MFFNFLNNLVQSDNQVRTLVPTIVQTKSISVRRKKCKSNGIMDGRTARVTGLTQYSSHVEANNPFSKGNKRTNEYISRSVFIDDCFGVVHSETQVLGP